MKKLLPFLVLASFSAFAGDLSLTLNCKTELQTDGDISTLTERPVVLSMAGKNAHIFQTELGFDQDNSVVVALSEVAKFCPASGCVDTYDTLYSLVVARVEDPIRNALQLASKAKIEGDTSNTAQIKMATDGSLTSQYVKNGKAVLGAAGLPEKLEFTYKISRKNYGKQKVSVSCSISQ